ncbi:hypothetical protein, partial [Yoonia sp. R2-816]|uniref:hypothetical protein n=1 Tax=Yoonia sp. R2-816 TaxID=3342638 RepID=UPI00372913FE
NLQIQFHGEYPHALPSNERAKVADFYAARDNTTPPLPWPSIAPPITHRRVVDKIGQLSIDLERRLPRRTQNQSVPEKRTHQPRRPKVSESAIAAARQAISELGPHADRQALLSRADAIWERESCVMR